MKPKEAKELIKSIKDRGWVEHNGVFLTPAQASKLCVSPVKKERQKPGIKTGWTDDYRNLKNKAERTDAFIQLMKIHLNIEMWPEFFFSTERQWRFDYCIPDHKVYIEVEGGIYSGGRHTRGKGFEADMEKYNTAASQGWRMIRTTPSNLLTEATINLIRNTLFLNSNIPIGM